MWAAAPAISSPFPLLSNRSINCAALLNSVSENRHATVWLGVNGL